MGTHEGFVALEDIAALEIGLQNPVGLGIFGEDEETGGVLVQPMHRLQIGRLVFNCQKRSNRRLIVLAGYRE